MRTFQLKTRDIILLLIAVVLNNIQITQMANNHMDISPKDLNTKTFSNGNSSLSIPFHQKTNNSDDLQAICSRNIECDNLVFPCIECKLTNQCVYGEYMNVTCNALPQVNCEGNKTFERVAQCRYCYQTEHWEHKCVKKPNNCNSIASPRSYYRTNCTVFPDIICLGRREFAKRIPCNWTGGARWSTALILSLTLGGFGADRFYLGHWQEGIGKLFSFGGLGVWTLLDVVLISVHHLGPADGSLYI